MAKSGLERSKETIQQAKLTRIREMQSRYNAQRARLRIQGIDAIINIARQHIAIS